MINNEFVRICNALSDEIRLAILQEIAQHEEICVCKLMEKFAMAQSKLSYHLKLLLQANLIKVKSQGKWNFYSVNSSLLAEVFSKKTINFFKINK